MNWIVKETGERREPNNGDGYLSNGEVHIAETDLHYGYKYPILTVTPSPSREEMEKEWKKLFYKEFDGAMADNSLQGAYYRWGFIRCYDHLFGSQDKTYTNLDTKEGVRRYIYGDE